MIHSLVLWLVSGVVVFSAIYLTMFIHEQFRRIQMSKGLNLNPTTKISVSYEWQPFGAIEGDSAKVVDIEDGQYLLYYKCPKGRFAPHLHFNTESGILKKGDVSVYTHKGNFTLKEGKAYTIEKGVVHWFDFHSDDNLLVLDFNPWFKNGNWLAKIE